MQSFSDHMYSKSLSIPFPPEFHDHFLIAMHLSNPPEFEPSPAMASSSSLFVSTRENILVVSVLLLVVVHLCITTSAAQVYTFEVVNEFPHDPAAFTQGLLYGGNDTLFESTGLYGESSVRKTDLHSGKIEVLHEMDEVYFGEGLTLLDERLFQVTWLTTTGFIYDRQNLSKLERFTHEMSDGWGLATDGEVLFGSDGSSTLYKLSPLTFKVLEKATIKYKDQEVQNLNELEYVNGEVWANVWLTDCIVRISPKDGVVVGWILLPSLREQLYQDGYTDIDVLNGIAWDSEKNRLFVTGKLWPKLYEINVHPVSYPFQESIEQLCLQSQALHFAECMCRAADLKTAVQLSLQRAARSDVLLCLVLLCLVPLSEEMLYSCQVISAAQGEPADSFAAHGILAGPCLSVEACSAAAHSLIQLIFIDYGNYIYPLRSSVSLWSSCWESYRLVAVHWICLGKQVLSLES